MAYEFFAYRGLSASFGFIANGRRVLVHVGSQGGTATGRLRNRQRGEAFPRLIRALQQTNPSAEVEAERHGRLDTPWSFVSKRLDAGGEDALGEGYRAGTTFRFDFVLVLDKEATAAELAASLGLSSITHGPVKVLWPDTAIGAPDVEVETAGETFRDRLHAAIEAVTDPSSTSQTKWRSVEELLSEHLGVPMDEVVVGYVSEKKHILNRLRQRAGQASLRMILTDDPEATRTTRRVLDDAADGKTKLDGGAVALATKTVDGWAVVSIVPLRQPTPEHAVRLAQLTGIDLQSADDETALAASLHLPVQWIRDVLWLLEDKKGIVLYGPPGTGKTYVAQKLARHLQKNDRLRTLVQLHPSYGYEEFFEGYRPVEDGTTGTLRLSKHAGPLKRLVTDLAASGEEIAVLVLDEMNRGNLPRVFGELYFLLEYRDRAVRLMYSPDEEFRLLDGLRIVGTMNTADRSVALLDQALRRRFHFVGLFPGEAPVAVMLRSYLREHYGERFDWLADALDAANAKLDRNVAIGPSHFMRSDLDDERVRRIWNHSVLPTIEEHYFGQDERLAEFALDALRPRRPDDDGPAAS